MPRWASTNAVDFLPEQRIFPLTTPEALSDVQLLDSLATSISQHIQNASINKLQVLLVGKRILFIHGLLRQLPNSRPSLQLLCVMRSGDYLIKHMTHPQLWPAVLKDNFTCQDCFTALQVRLQKVWRLHSTADWATEESAARQVDEKANATLIVHLWAPRLHEFQRGGGLGAMRPGVTRIGALVDPPAGSDAKVVAFSDSSREGSVNSRQPLATQGEAGVSPSPASNGMATTEEIIQYYRHRQRGFWKISYEDLDRSTAEQVSLRSHVAECGYVPRFKVRHGFLLQDRPVVVKELLEPAALLNPDTVASFVEDAVMRMRWCHPGVAKYYGGYTERFTTPGMESLVGRMAAERGEAYFPLVPFVEALSKGTSTVVHPTSSADDGEESVDSWEATVGGNWSRQSFVLDMANPFLALGLVVEDLTLRPLDTSPSNTPYEEEQSQVGASFQCLHDLLFVQKHRFTMYECIDIVLQVTDALQYILLDAQEVPPEVVTAWLSVAPSNVFVSNELRWTTGVVPVASNRSSSALVGPPVEGRYPNLLCRNPEEYYVTVAQDNSRVASQSFSDTTVTRAVARETVVVKYAPPSYIAGGPCSRWRPHPRATVPACYTLAQLLLSLLTGSMPYHNCMNQADLAQRLQSTNQDMLANRDVGWGGSEVNVRIGASQGFAISAYLPDQLSGLLREALTFQKPTRAAEDEVWAARRPQFGHLTLQTFRERLLEIRNSHGETHWNAVRHLIGDERGYRNAPMGYEETDSGASEMMSPAGQAAAWDDYGVAN